MNCEYSEIEGVTLTTTPNNYAELGQKMESLHKTISEMNEKLTALETILTDIQFTLKSANPSTSVRRYNCKVCSTLFLHYDSNDFIKHYCWKLQIKISHTTPAESVTLETTTNNNEEHYFDSDTHSSLFCQHYFCYLKTNEMFCFLKFLLIK